MSRTQRLSFIVAISLSIGLAVWAQPRGGAGMRQGRAGAVAVFNSPVQAKDGWEKAILAVLDDMDKTQRRGNMNTRQADPKFVEAITTNKDLETLFLHMDGSGVSVTLKKH